MERPKFEDSWKDSFKDAEVSPSENLWTNIELDLERAEGKAMKKRVLFFKLLAAASVLFAMTFAGVGLYYINKDQSAGQGAQIASTTANQNEASSSGVAQSGNVADKGSGSAENSQADQSSVGQDKTTSETASPESDQQTAAISAKESTNKITPKNNGTTSPAGSSNSKKNGDSGSPANSKIKNLPTLKTDGADETLTKAQFKNSSHQNLANRTPSASHSKSTIIASDNTAEKRETNAYMSSTGDTKSRSGSLNAAASEPTLTSSVQKLPPLVRVNVSNEIPARSYEADPVALMMARLKDDEAKYTEKATKKNKEKGKRDESIWTSIGFAAGSFNSHTGGGQDLSLADNQQAQSSLARSANRQISDEVISRQSSASGSAYSLGLSVGGKVANRWVIQGGINYMTQSSAYSSNAVVASSGFADLQAASINEADKIKNSSGKADKAYVITAPYNVNSSLQYMSIPLQAGYIIVNRSFGVQMNAGVSTDLFIRNTLTPDQGTLEKVSQGNGEDSPYRPVNFSGLVGTELSYRFARHYRVAVNPGLRYPLNSIYKSDISVSSMPLTFDVGLRFRYIFH